MANSLRTCDGCSAAVKCRDLRAGASHCHRSHDDLNAIAMSVYPPSPAPVAFDSADICKTCKTKDPCGPPGCHFCKYRCGPMVACDRYVHDDAICPEGTGAWVVKPLMHEPRYDRTCNACTASCADDTPGHGCDNGRIHRSADGAVEFHFGRASGMYVEHNTRGQQLAELRAEVERLQEQHRETVKHHDAHHAEHVPVTVTNAELDALRAEAEDLKAVLEWALKAEFEYDMRGVPGGLLTVVDRIGRIVTAARNEVAVGRDAEEGKLKAHIATRDRAIEDLNEIVRAAKPQRACGFCGLDCRDRNEGGGCGGERTGAAHLTREDPPRAFSFTGFNGSVVYHGAGGDKEAALKAQAGELQANLDAVTAPPPTMDPPARSVAEYEAEIALLKAEKELETLLRDARAMHIAIDRADLDVVREDGDGRTLPLIYRIETLIHKAKQATPPETS